MPVPTFLAWCATLLLPVVVAHLPLAHAQPAPPHTDAAEFRACLQGLREAPAFRAVTPATFATHTDGLVPDASVLLLLDRQPEFTLAPWDYLAVLVDAERVADGRAGYARWQDTLAQIERQTGVAAPIVVGVWGVESNFVKRAEIFRAGK